MQSTPVREYPITASREPPPSDSETAPPRRRGGVEVTAEGVRRRLPAKARKQRRGGSPCELGFVPLLRRVSPQLTFRSTFERFVSSGPNSSSFWMWRHFPVPYLHERKEGARLGLTQGRGRGSAEEEHIKSSTQKSPPAVKTPPLRTHASTGSIRSLYNRRTHFRTPSRKAFSSSADHLVFGIPVFERRD